MPTPLEQALLAKAGSIGPATSDQIAENAQAEMPAWKQAAQTGLNGGMDALKGLVGIGDGHSAPNAAGQFLSAMAPIGSGVLNERQLLRELLGIIKGAEPPNPAQMFLGEKVGGYTIPHRGMVAAPKGFEFPPEMGTPWFGRDPALTEQYVAQKNSLPSRYSDITTEPIKYKNPKASVPNGGTGIIRSNQTFKANPDMVRAIRKMAADGQSFEEINKAYPLNKSTLKDIITGGSWSSIK